MATIVIALMVGMYWEIYKLSSKISKVITTIELCPHCPHEVKKQASIG